MQGHTERTKKEFLPRVYTLELEDNKDSAVTVRTELQAVTCEWTLKKERKK